MSMNREELIEKIRKVPNFPIPGILFYDVTTLFKDPGALKQLGDDLYEMYKEIGRAHV